jgi:hypothetical protein
MQKPWAMSGWQHQATFANLLGLSYLPLVAHKILKTLMNQQR